MRLSGPQTTCLSGFLLCATLTTAEDLQTITLPDETLAHPTAEHDVELPTLVVTGELLRRESAETTSSVAVYNGDEIDRSTARDLYDVIRATPNAALEDNDYGFGGMSLRGIGSYGASGAGAFASYGTTSVVVLDGVGLPRAALAYADLSAFDLDSVEVFRGPQSTSQGRNAMAGAVVITTAQPQFDGPTTPQLRGRFGAGDQARRQYAGALNVTLWPDTLAMRLVHDERRDDSDIRNQTRNQTDAARRDARTTRLRGRFQPGGWQGDYAVLFSISDISRYSGSRYVLLSEEHRRTALNDQPQDFENRAQMFSLQQSLNLSQRWSLRATSAYFESDTFSRFDTDYSAEDGGATEQWESAYGFSQEIRALYDGSQLRASAGVYYADEHNADDTSGYLELSYLLSSSGLPVAGVPLGRVNYQGANPSDVRDYAVFGEVEWQLSPRLALIAGARIDKEENSRVITTAYEGNSAVSALLVQALAGSVLPADGSVSVERAFSEVLPKAAVRYELFDGWFIGASYAEGYRPGGDGYNQVSGRYFSFDAERTQNTELSLKGSYSPWRVQTALNLFYTRWTDMQVQGGQGTDTYMENAGQATISGGELEFRWRPRGLSALQLIGGYGLTHGRFDRYVSTEGDNYAGHRLPKAPQYTATLALEWMPFQNLLIRPDVLWVGSTPANADNNPTHTLYDYQLVNLSVRWQIADFTAFLSATNLSDEHYRRDANNYGSAGYDVVSLGEGRRLFGGIEFHL